MSLEKKTNETKKVLLDFPTVVLFGRTNVGKSTLFNKIVGQAHAMVSRQAGTTRDSNQKIVEWQGRRFNLIDTGGIIETAFLRGKNKLKKIRINEDDINAQVQLQIKDYLKKADLIFFVADAKSGLLEQDKEMSLALKRIFPKNKKIVLVVNKADSIRDQSKIAEFYKLALGDPCPVSAATGSGVGDLLEIACQSLKLKKGKAEEKKAVKISLIGRPNVGKSSLLNAIIGEKKVIVSQQAHTTREPQDFSISYNDINLCFIDTAGIIRAKSKVSKQEFIKLGINKSLDSLKKSDIALLIIDINEGITHQDTKLVDEILSRRVSVIIVANKWDKVEQKETKQYTNYINSKLPFLTWAPIIFLSAKNKTKIGGLLDIILTVHKARNLKVEENDLDEFLQSAVRHSKPLTNIKVRGIIKQTPPKMKLTKIRQTYVNPPEFTLQIKSKFGLRDNYLRYLENRLRDKFGFIGTPVKIEIRHKN